VGGRLAEAIAWVQEEFDALWNSFDALWNSIDAVPKQHPFKIRYHHAEKVD
jgi:hypothetical protein